MVFVILHWFWEGDSYLVNSYVGIGSTIEQAESIIDSQKETLDEGLQNRIKTYYPGENIPKEDDGNYYADSFYQIIRENLVP